MCVSGKHAAKNPAPTFKCKEGHIISIKELRSPEDPGTADENEREIHRGMPDS